MINPQNLKNRQEQFEEFVSTSNKKIYIQYDYRDENGKLFSCIKPTLNECREEKNNWIKRSQKPSINNENDKRFRDKNGNLTIYTQELAQATIKEAEEYYQDGELYKYKGKKYILVKSLDTNGNVDKIELFSDNGEHIVLINERMGTFLPDVASYGLEIEKASTDIFLRKEVFEHRVWYNSLILFLSTGTCKPDKEDYIQPLRCALLQFGNHTKVKNGNIIGI